jgi:hypothetical protein
MDWKNELVVGYGLIGCPVRQPVFNKYGNVARVCPYDSKACTRSRMVRCQLKSGLENAARN